MYLPNLKSVAPVPEIIAIVVTGLGCEPGNLGN